MNLKNLLQMESDMIRIADFSVSYYSVNTLIIGSGAASLNAAISLRKKGMNDLLVATSKWGAGTSNNAGSDKQTYYKLSLGGTEPDSARSMARDLFNGKCMHGDIALCEAQGSVQAFMRLVDLGVPFPHDRFGSWAGYKTDNDPRARGTSAGPRTSQMMFRILSDEVIRLNINILDNHQIISLLTNETGSAAVGAVAVNTGEKDPKKALVLFNATNIVLGTGGPGDLYESSVYPVSQKGSTGMAFRAGATGQNLTESQFGIASVGFRWNLSGSYQQVIPRYFSTDRNGREPREFLNEYFPDYRRLSGSIFRKGYQWPFDPMAIANFGSSLIDMLVYRETMEKRRRVFLDFTRNISWNGSDEFNKSTLDEEAYSYLEKSDSLQNNPVERLLAMNSQAYNLYRENGIDLSATPLEIGICAQHNNGGLKGGIWWESDLRHLFPVGEVNGSHGVCRPGGAALNAGQVGSYRAAHFISRKYNQPPHEKNRFMNMIKVDLEDTINLVNRFLSASLPNRNKEILAGIRENMSTSASIIRDSHRIQDSAKKATDLFNEIKEMLSASSAAELAECFHIIDNCTVQLIYLKAIKRYIELGGRSRGSYLITSTGDIPSIDMLINNRGIDLCDYDRDIEKKIMELRLLNGEVIDKLVEVREIPDQDLWFEKVWRDYIEDNYIES
jgi:succinate dehydrogenase/fumarate reductase flavoprotein subunit